MNKICVFDLDGTLLNTLESIAFFVNKAFENRGLGNVPTDKIRQFVGHGARNLITQSLAYAGGDSADLDDILKEYIALYNSDPTYLIEPYEGICDMLEELKQAGVTLAVLSNKPHSSTSEIVAKIFGADCFYRCDGQRDGVPLKPDPTATLSITEGFDKKGCYYIGDSPGDIETAHNAKIHSIAVTWGFRSARELEKAKPEFVANKPQDIVEFVLR